MCTYDHHEYISQAIEGVMTQEVSFPIKLIISDDYSSDGTREICLQYRDKYPELIELILPKENTKSKVVLDKLFPACFNSGAKYVAMCEGDDYWCDSSKLQKQIDFLEKETEFSGCAHNTEILKPCVSDENDLIVKTRTKSVFTINDFTRGEAYFHTSSMVYRVEKFEKIDFETYKKFPGDSVFLTMMASVGPIKYLDQVMSIYRIHERGAWSRLNEIEQLCLNLTSTIKCNKALGCKYEENYLPLFVRSSSVGFITNKQEIMSLIKAYEKEDLIKIIEYLYIFQKEKTADVDSKSEQISILQAYNRELNTQIKIGEENIEEQNILIMRQEEKIIDLKNFRNTVLSSRGWKFINLLRSFKTLISERFKIST
ncbi:glycosyltransferase [Vibrio genomosp. F10 str. 9ZC157]|nr:glycosyltransferase [Vibrio genomosp. F10]